MPSLDVLARSGSHIIRHGYDRYRTRFKEVTRRARKRFEARDWLAGQRDSTKRLDLYRKVVDTVVRDLEGALGDKLRDRPVWRRMREIHREEVDGYAAVELAETFFNSVTRRIFATVGVDPVVEYVDLDPRRDRYGPGATVFRRYPRGSATSALVARILEDYAFDIPHRAPAEDADLVAAEIDAAWEGAFPGAPLGGVELVRSVFFRGSGAYLVGRMRGGEELLPLVLVLVHGDGGIEVDAVLTTEREVSIVFSYTRAHFHVDVARPSETIRFLSTIIPRKRIAELYIGLGYTKHGKTEIYRDLLGHLGRSMDVFEHAPGDTGMVMIVFTLRYYDYVFKVIRDRFAYPKTTTREDVIERYQLVFEHDRAGRLIEAQEFEHLTFDRRRFSPELLEELSTAAADSVTVEGDEVAIRHIYIERKVRPLNLFLREEGEELTARAVLDYGQAIRDLACSNIFPGDMLLKNFGVTNAGRVIFYDYDELCLVTECRFRDMPVPHTDEDEMRGEPYFYVGENDVFPEEFLHFMGLEPELRRLFVEAHADLLTADLWRDLQRRHRAGEVIDIFPYPPSRRLRERRGSRRLARDRLARRDSAPP